MNHIMLDLRAADSLPGAAITAIAAVSFNPQRNELGKKFYHRVDIASSQKHGGTIGGEWVKAFLRQDSAARSEVATEDSLSITEALRELCHFILRETSAGGLTLWSGSKDLSIPILLHALGREGIAPPWRAGDMQDMNTLLFIARSAGVCPDALAPFEGQPHHALDTALHQAEVVNALYRTAAARLFFRSAL